MPSGIKKVAVFCIITSGTKYLLLKRAFQPNQGKYVPVGGKIDPFESPHDAVIRETFEETKILLSAAAYCGTLVETSPVDYNWVSFIYSAEIDFIPAPYCDEGILEWIDAAALKDLDTPHTDWHIYQYISHGKKFAFDAIFDADLKMTSMIDQLSGRHCV